MDAVVLAAGERHERPGEVTGVRRAAHLVEHHPQLVALGPRRIMVSTKLLPPRPKSHEERDEMARVGRRRGSLPASFERP